MRADHVGPLAAAHPARERDGLRPHLVVAELAELRLGPGDRAGVGLAAAGTRADLGRQRFDDAIAEVALQRRLAQLFDGLAGVHDGGQQERRKHGNDDRAHGNPQRLSESRISRNSRISSEGAAVAASAGLFIRL